MPEGRVKRLNELGFVKKKTNRRSTRPKRCQRDVSSDWTSSVSSGMVPPLQRHARRYKKKCMSATYEEEDACQWHM